MQQATTASTRTEAEVIEKKERKKRGSGVLSQLGALAKDVQALSQDIEKTRDEARAGETKRAEENARLVKIVRTVFGGKFEAHLRTSINAEPEDLTFCRDTFGFNC